MNRRARKKVASFGVVCGANWTGSISFIRRDELPPIQLAFPRARVQDFSQTSGVTFVLKSTSPMFLLRCMLELLPRMFRVSFLSGVPKLCNRLQRQGAT